MLEILYQDEDIVAINKPSGLLVHRSLIDKHETAFAVQMTRDQIKKKVYTVHRLDKPTSGVLLFALHQEAARRLTQSFTDGQVEKHYYALVRGHTDEKGHIDYPLKEVLDPIADAKADQDKAAQAAITDYVCLQHIELPYPVGRYNTVRYAWLNLTPKTGRRHQIRRHLKHIAHPIIGDTTHGDGRHNAFFRKQYQLMRLMLHADTLKIAHPMQAKTVTIEAPLPEDMQQALSKVGVVL